MRRRAGFAPESLRLLLEVGTITLIKLIQLARDIGFTELGIVRDHVRPAVELRPGGPRSAPGVGFQWGGQPALPLDVSWPQWDGRSLAFIAQIDLGMIPTSLAAEGYPRQGRLLFFYDAEQSTWGFDTKDAGSFTVIYLSDPGVELAVPDWPADLPEYARYKLCPLEPIEILSLPPFEDLTEDDRLKGDSLVDSYDELLELMDGGGWSERGLIGGYPDQIQNEMTRQCAEMAIRLSRNDATIARPQLAAGHRETAEAWRLLLQVPSESEAEMMWGDVGCLYFWICESDLRDARFDRVWMILQCF